MARLRKFVAYRRLERPYTRVSKYRSKSFVKARPSVKISRFNNGNVKADFKYNVYVTVDDSIQIRQEALESARQTINRYIERKCGNKMYHLKLLKYPHQVLRENPLASGAGADRLSSGMKHAFGKIIGIAVRVKKGDPLFLIRVNKENLTSAMEAAKKGGYKLPCKVRIKVTENK